MIEPSAFSWAEEGPVTCDITETSLTPSTGGEPMPPCEIYCTGYVSGQQDLMNKVKTGLASAHSGQGGSRSSYKSLECFSDVFAVRWSWPQVQSFTEGMHHSSGERGKENRAKVSQRSNNIS